MLFFPIYNADPTFKAYFDQLVKINKNGMFVAIFLNEARKVADLLFPDMTNDEAKSELIDLLGFLCDMYDRKNGHKFRFFKKYIRIDVALTANTETLIRNGHEFYVDKCFQAFQQGVYTVYILALGYKTEDAMMIEEMFNVKHPNFAETCRFPYMHVFEDKRKRSGICIEFDRCEKA